MIPFVENNRNGTASWLIWPRRTSSNAVWITIGAVASMEIHGLDKIWRWCGRLDHMHRFSMTEPPLKSQLICGMMKTGKPLGPISIGCPLTCEYVKERNMKQKLILEFAAMISAISPKWCKMAAYRLAVQPRGTENTTYLKLWWHATTGARIWTTKGCTRRHGKRHQNARPDGIYGFQPFVRPPSTTVLVEWYQSIDDRAIVG